MEMAGKSVMVTGASSGIGEACARAFATRQARLVLVARRRERLEALAAELRTTHGVEVIIGVADVGDRVKVEALVSRVLESLGGIDILVNNAGLSRGLAPLHEGEVADWQEMIHANLEGLLWVTRSVLPSMVSRGSGHVINIGSIAGHEVYPGGNVYCATKHGVTALTRGLAIDLLGTGVRVSSVDPGMVATEFSLVRFRGDEERARAAYQGLEPLTAEDVADAVVFCATRPAHANVRELVLLPTAEASVNHFWRGSR